MDKTIARCKTCGLIVKSSGNTVNLWNHQERKHNLQRKNQKRKYSATVSSVSSARDDDPDDPSLQEQASNSDIIRSYLNLICFILNVCFLIAQIINPPSPVVFNTNSAIATSTSTALASMPNPSPTITVTSNSKIRNLTLSESFERTKSFSGKVIMLLQEELFNKFILEYAVTIPL